MGVKGKRMKSVLASIQPKYVELIARGKKTIEVRKTAPKCEVPFKCYIYCTFPKKPVYTLWLNRGTENKFLADGKVIGEFVCDKVDEFTQSFFDEQEPRDTEEISFYLDQFNMSYNELFHYVVGLKKFYGWHISDLKIYDKPKELSEYIRECRQPAEIQCENCPYCNWYDDHFCTDKRRTITRPPQSWCYVDELEVW